jgi:hypothetical protein
VLWFLSGTFVKLQKATIGFVMSVCMSVRPHGTAGLQLELFHEILCLSIFLKTCPENPSVMKI